MDDSRSRRVEDLLRQTISKIYIDQAEGLSEDQAQALATQVDAYLETVRAALPDNEFIDIDLATRIADACKDLLALYPKLSEKDRASVVGAARYFIEQHDADDDLESVLGFEDDMEVVNFVIALIKADIPLIRLEN